MYLRFPVYLSDKHYKNTISKHEQVNRKRVDQ